MIDYSKVKTPNIDYDVFNHALNHYRKLIREESGVPSTGIISKWFIDEVGIEIRYDWGKIYPYRLIDAEKQFLYKIAHYNN